MRLKVKAQPRILVINSPLFREKNDKYDEDSLPPIGLGLIATALEEIEADVHFIDAVADNIPLMELIPKVQRLQPVFICINIFSTNLILVKEFVESLQLNVHLIIGGLSTKDLQTEIFSWVASQPIDIVHGDGEKIVPDIVKHCLKQEPLFRQGNKRYFQVDQNSSYFVKDISLDRLNRKFFTNEPIAHPLGFSEATIITSRGCVYNCAFCAAARSVNRSLGIREKSHISVINEIQYLIDFYPGLQSIRVLDDLFLKNKSSIDRAIEIFSSFNLQWRAMAHVETFRNVDAETVRKLKESGCAELFFGIESGSPRILKQIHKCHKSEIIKRSIGIVLQNGIDVKGYFIFGFPSETQEDFKMTYILAKYLRNKSKKFRSRFRVSSFQYRPYHGTELYQQIESKQRSEVEKIDYIRPNHELSGEIGRLQFNFHSGNYSAEDTAVVEDYIIRTTKLNSLRTFGPAWKAKGISSTK